MRNNEFELPANTRKKKKERKRRKSIRRKEQKKERINDLETRIFVLLLHKFQVNLMIIMYKYSLLIVLYLLKNSDY